MPLRDLISAIATCDSHTSKHEVRQLQVALDQNTPGQVKMHAALIIRTDEHAAPVKKKKT
jgi:hypothetical protein